MSLRLKTIDGKRAEEISKLTNGAIEFTIINGSIKGVVCNTEIGPIHIVIESYSVQVSELEKKEIWYLGFFAEVAGDKIFIEKEFDSEYERNCFVDNNLAGTHSMSELVLDNREVLA